MPALRALAGGLGLDVDFRGEVAPERILTSGLGWQVQAAGQAILKNWGLDQILSRLEMIRDQVDGQFTLKELRYLIAGRRISHIKGILAQVLNIKPIILINHEDGHYEDGGRAITLQRALDQIVKLKEKHFRSQ